MGERVRRRKFARDRGNPYKTDILELNSTGETCCFRLRIARGFRHQIRCHLSWLGYPILNDGLYGGMEEADGMDQALALKAQGLFFRDPLSGEDRQYRLPPVETKGFLGYHVRHEL
jgi:23S rRNA pseudouridine1911/1915/1917 synthase